MVGGFTENCSDCIPTDDQTAFSYGSLFTTNTGIMLAIYLCVLTFYLILYIGYRVTKKRADKQTTEHYLWKRNHIYTKYYTIAAVFAFSGNLMFSALMMLYQTQLKGTATAINIFLAVIVVVAYLTFQLAFLSWSRKLNNDYIHP